MKIEMDVRDMPTVTEHGWRSIRCPDRTCAWLRRLPVGKVPRGWDKLRAMLERHLREVHSK